MKKKKRQFSRASVMYIVLGITLIGVMTLIGTSAFLSVNFFVINGASVYTPEQIIEASGVSRGDNLLYLNEQTVASNIRKELPYISTVEISREFPDTLTITVVESTAVAYLYFAGDIVVIDATGRVLERSPIAISLVPNLDVKGLVEVRGVLVSEAMVGLQIKSEAGVESYFQAMQNVLISMEREGLIDDVNYLDVSNINNINFGFRELYRVVLGGISDLRTKLGTLKANISQIQSTYPNTRVVINMSDPSGDIKFSPE
ncbi:MAG: FtsQ-type POTRA domain-containing protein [Oscillospiraceae bacterium]|nr:FtsQ-type POTRA domain-containing protein [Oscillospiraceae bacterium]